MATAVSRTEPDGSRDRPLTIGAVCRRLQDEFPDISISKIRYLEDQGLLAPRRTQGGYRLFTEDDVDRLETILRLQRDEFLPLRVIRQELAAPQRKPAGDALRLGRARAGARLRRALRTHGRDARRSCATSRITASSSPEGRAASGAIQSATSTSSAPASQLARYGIEPRNLRPFRTGAEQEAAKLEQIVAPEAPLAQPRAAPGRARGSRGSRRAFAGALAAPLLARAFARSSRS